MKLSQDDKLLLLEGRLKEAIAASRKIRQGRYPGYERTGYVSSLVREVERATKLVGSL